MKRKSKLLAVTLFALLLMPINIAMGADVIDAVTCMKVDTVTQEAKGESIEFLTTTPEIYVRLVLSGASPGEVLQVGWFLPGGASWQVDNIDVTSETVYWASLEVDGTTAVFWDGIWTATIYHGVDLENLEEKTSINFKIVDYQEVITDFNDTLNYYADQIETLAEENGVLVDQLEALSDQYAPLENQILSLKGQLIALEADYTIVNSDLQSVQNEYASLNSTYYEALADLEEAKESLNQAQQSQGPSTTLFYIAIAAAVIGILAAAYFAMKARGSM